MPVELLANKPAGAKPVHLVAKDGLERAGLAPAILAWAKPTALPARRARCWRSPARTAQVAGALFGTGQNENASRLRRTGPQPAGRRLAFRRPAGASGACRARRGARRLCLHPLRQEARPQPCAWRCPTASMPPASGASPSRLPRRDLVNTPTNDMGPTALEAAVRKLAGQHRPRSRVTVGDDLLSAEFPDDPRRRPRLRRRAAPDRHALGADSTRPR